MPHTLPLATAPAAAPTVDLEEFVSGLGPKELSGVRVVFINLPLRESQRPNVPPQGPGLLAARLRHYGAEVSIIDLNAYRIGAWPSVMIGSRTYGLTDPTPERPNGRHLTFEEAETVIAAHFNKHGEPDIVALSGIITTLRWQRQVAAICRRLVGNTFIVSGNGLATELKAGLFGESWIPDLDAIGHSEGDASMLAIAHDVKRAKEAKGVRIPDWRANRFCTGHINGRARFIYPGNRPKNLDTLPFAAWDLLHEDVFGNPVLDWYINTPVWGAGANNSSAAPFTMNRSLTTVSSRGCPYECTFCYRGSQGERQWRMRSAENLAAEAAWLIKTYGVDFIGFPDDNFAVSKARMDGLVGPLAPLNIRWGTHTRMDEADARIIPMKKAGCIYLGFGAESASAPVLDRMKKKGHILSRGETRINGFTFPTTMVEAIRNCRDHGVHANCTWIMGFPGETLADLKTSVGFILWQVEEMTRGLTPGSAEYNMAKAAVNRRMFTATAYPGTEMFHDPSVTGKLIRNFGITFDHKGEPVADEALRTYVEELDDATKMLTGIDDKPLNYGAMPDDQFIEARGYIDRGELEKVLDMK